MEENQVLNQGSLQQQAPEKIMIPQSEMNAVVKREKQMAYESAKQEAEREYMQKLEAMKQQGMQQHQRNENVSREVDANAIYQQVQEKFNQEMQQRQLQKEMEQVANNYISKMQQGKNVYDDFDEITKDFDPTAFPQLIYLVSGVENAADVIYDLSRNPSKLVTLDNLAQRSPKLAQAELQRLSRSIAENNIAKKEASGQSVAEPLDKLKPSRISGSNGQATISDLRNQSWLKG